MKNSLLYLSFLYSIRRTIERPGGSPCLRPSAVDPVGFPAKVPRESIMLPRLSRSGTWAATTAHPPHAATLDLTCVRHERRNAGRGQHWGRLWRRGRQAECRDPFPTWNFPPSPPSPPPCWADLPPLHPYDGQRRRRRHRFR